MIVEYKDIDSVIDNRRGFSRKYIQKLKREIILAAKEASNVVEEKKLLPYIKIRANNTLLNQAIIDAVEDLKRLQEFHPVKRANAIKEAAYLGFWVIKRKPIYIDGDLTKLNLDSATKQDINKLKAKFLFINESVVAYYLIPKIFNVTKIICEHCDTLFSADEWKKARANLIYFLAYRAESPKSIEGILSAMTLHPIWETNQNFWLCE